MNYGDLLFKEASPDQLKELFVKYGIRAPGDIKRAIEIHGEVVSDEIDNILNDNFLGGKLLEKSKGFVEKMRNKKNAKSKDKVGIFQKVKDSQLLNKAKGSLAKNTSEQPQPMSAPTVASSPRMGGIFDKIKETVQDTLQGKKEEKAKKEAEAIKEAENKKKTQMMLIIGGVSLVVVLVVVLIVVNKK